MSKLVKFDLYQNNKKIKSINQIKSLDEGELVILEKNYIMSHFWWLKVLIVDIIMGFIGSTYDDDEVKPLKKVTINYKNIQPDMFSIEITDKKIYVKGVETYNISKYEEIIPDLMVRRIENKRKLIITLALSIILIIFSIIALLIILNS